VNLTFDTLRGIGFFIKALNEASDSTNLGLSGTVNLTAPNGTVIGAIEYNPASKQYSLVVG
jgi:hypothetical protein